MKLAITSLLGLTLIGCGTETRVNPVFESGLSTFKREAEIRNKVVDLSGISVEFVEEAKKVGMGLEFGHCDGGSITIVRSYWEAQLAEAQEILLFHELGHCALGRESHVQYGSKRSLMIADPTMIDRVDYANHRSEYLDELFDK